LVGYLSSTYRDAIRLRHPDPRPAARPRDPRQGQKEKGEGVKASSPPRVVAALFAANAPLHDGAFGSGLAMSPYSCRSLLAGINVILRES